ncbi:DUF418 domain-containing protein [Actinophytocola sp.]|uniref:DUF418 domain-containing protein n=1 Tax=Actinophytocola sp. TaxID=1872138 RepID=UPI002ED907F4
MSERQTENSPPLGAMGPRSTALRSLAPDLSRGLMLLLIALVHASVFRSAWASAGGPGYAVSDPLSQVLSCLVTLFADDRGFALFAGLFGYGVAQIYLRSTAEGREWPVVRALLRRRGRWLMVIGLLHTVLLAFGDILSVYGLVALLFAGALRFTGRKLLTRAFTWLAVGTLVYSIGVPMLYQVVSGDGSVPTNPADDLIYRLGWPLMIPLVIGTTVFPFLIGIWAARRRLLDEPERHRAFLRKVAVLGIVGTALGGLPYALINTGVLGEASPLAYIGAYWLNLIASYAGGFGYAAVIALIAIRLGNRRGPVVTALAATGQRSMTCYLLQSVAWLGLGAPYLLGLGNTMSDLAALGTGVAVWVATVVIADVMRRRDIRGPAEVVYRRLTYGRAYATPKQRPEPATVGAA